MSRRTRRSSWPPWLDRPERLEMWWTMWTMWRVWQVEMGLFFLLRCRSLSYSLSPKSRLDGACNAHCTCLTCCNTTRIRFWSRPFPSRTGQGKHGKFGVDESVEKGHPCPPHWRPAAPQYDPISSDIKRTFSVKERGTAAHVRLLDLIIRSQLPHA